MELKDTEMKKTRGQIEQVPLGNPRLTRTQHLDGVCTSCGFQIERSVFADFCAEIGVETIREYEQEHLKQQTELDKKQYDQHVSESTTQTSRGQP